jgi:hypothetical protein
LRLDYARQTPETDLSHLEEILALHDLSRDPAAGSFEDFKNRCLRNIEMRAMHHHVFLPKTVSAVLDDVGFSVRHQNLEDSHMITLAEKDKD